MKPFPTSSVPLYAFALSVVLLPAARPVFAHVASDRRIQELSVRIEREPGNTALHLRRGELHRVERNWPAALADYESARKLAPGLVAVDLGQARMHLDAGQPEQARRWADRFLARQSDHVQALLTRVRALTRLGEAGLLFESREPSLEEALSPAADDLAAHIESFYRSRHCPSPRRRAGSSWPGSLGSTVTYTWRHDR